jgi:transcriptional regulator with XRE-family HTH domain
MKKNLDQYLQNLSAESRKNVDARANEILAEEMGLQELRKAMQYSQKVLAEKLHVKQGEISKIEHRTDMLVSTLREYVEQLGRSLEITVHFPDKKPIKITQFEIDDPEQSGFATAS